MTRTKQTPAAFGLLVFTLLMGGCSWFSWIPGIEDDSSKKKESDKPAKLVKFDAEVQLRRQWQVKVGQGLGKKYLRFRPVIVADQIFAADGYGSVFAIDRFNGDVAWRTQFDKVEEGGFNPLGFMDRRDPSFVTGALGAGEGLLAIGTSRGEVVALSVADGSEVWRSVVGAEVGAPPTVGRSMVFVHSIDGRITALRSDDGSVAWTYDNPVPLLTLRGTAAPVYSQDVVYVGFASGKITALRAENGEPLWEQRIMLPEGRSELERIVDVDASPLVLGSTIYAVAYQGRVLGLARRDGRPLWEQELSSYLDLTVGYGQIYAVGSDDSVTAVDQETGEVSWTQDIFKRRGMSTPLAFSNYVAVGDSEGYLHLLAQRDGRMVGRTRVDSKGINAKMIVADGTLYVLNNTGRLAAYKVNLD